MVLLMANHGSLANADLYCLLGAALATSPADEIYSSPDMLEMNRFQSRAKVPSACWNVHLSLTTTSLR